MRSEARVERTEAHAEEQIDLADDASEDFDENGKLNHMAIERHKLMIETRKCLMSRYFPKLYGDRVQVDQQVTVASMSDYELERAIMRAAEIAGLDRGQIDRILSPAPAALDGPVIGGSAGLAGAEQVIR